MERETELETQSWNSATKEKERLHQALLPQLVGSEMEAFSLPKPVDDDGTDISLKDWQLGLRSSEPTTMYPSKPSKRSTRARFTPVQPWLDEFVISSPDKFDTAPTTPRRMRTSASGTRSGSVSPPTVDSSRRGDSSLPEVGLSNGDGPNVDEVTGSESPGITFDVARLNDAELDNFSNRASAYRGSPLRVSFVDESEVSRSLSPPRVECRSLSMPKTRVQPTLHGVRPREGKDSAFPLPEVETAHQSHGISASRDRGTQLRHSGRQARRSLDSIVEGSKYDSAFDFTSSSSASSYQSQRENSSVSDPNSPSALLRCNARREHNDEENDEDEDVKVGILCGGGLSDTGISADVVRLVSKLCRLSVPLPEQSALKPSQEIGHNRSNSVPALISWDSMQDNLSLPCQDFPILGRQTSLKLLCERCSSGPTPAYDLPKPRKIRDVQPYQHFYKPISKTLDQKLRS
ncbi:hypothetical protein M758_12G121900 [Ceratodon purpureus]|nr:hypothetical protein M758_12G121900 [Ceratodon purpureus]